MMNKEGFKKGDVLFSESLSRYDKIYPYTYHIVDVSEHMVFFRRNNGALESLPNELMRYATTIEKIKGFLYKN